MGQVQLKSFFVQVAVSQFYEFGEGIGASPGASGPASSDDISGKQTLGGNPIPAAAASSPSADIGGSSSSKAKSSVKKSR